MRILYSSKEINRSLWNSLAEKSSVASWFQTQEAYSFFDSLSFLEAFCVAVQNGGKLKGVVVGFIQKDGGKVKQFFSRRAIINGGPLLADVITEEELTALLKATRQVIKRKAIYVETRNFNDYSRWREVFVRCGFGYEPHYDIIVDSSSMDVVNAKLGKSRKRDIKVSLRDGATLVDNPTIDQISDYYSILMDLYEKKVKTPLFPFVFFEELYKIPSSAFLLVEYQGKIIGGTVCVGLQGRSLYEMFACGKDGVYKNIFPSELATFAGVQYAVENGYAIFDMMGAGKPDDGGYGVRDFKLKFGGDLVEYGRYKNICKPLLYKIGTIGIKILKKL